MSKLTTLDQSNATTVDLTALGQTSRYMSGLALTASGPPLPELPLVSVGPIILSFLERAADVANFLDALQGNNLQVASGYLGQPELVSWRLMLGGLTGYEVLMKAVYGDNEALAKWGPNHLDIKTVDGFLGPTDGLNSAMYTACGMGHTNAAHGILDTACVDGYVNLGIALMAACQEGHVDTVRMLVLHGGAPVWKHHLEQASYAGHAEAFEVLFEHGVDHGAVDTAMHGWLKVASERGHASMVHMLSISKGVNVHAGGGYAMYVASRNGHFACVEILLQNGAKVHSEALIVACRHHHTLVFGLLLEQRGEVPWKALQRPLEGAFALRLLRIPLKL